MNWHKGNIVEAVAESKLKNAVFVVYIEGRDDELSNKLQSFLDNDSVREKLETPDFVAIKIQGDSPAYGQFLSLYKVVPIPSIFFIGKTGTPLDIATGMTASVKELTAKIDKVRVAAGKYTEPEAVEASGIASLESAALPAVSNIAERSAAGVEPDDDQTKSMQEQEEAAPSKARTAGAATVKINDTAQNLVPETVAASSTAADPAADATATTTQPTSAFNALRVSSITGPLTALFRPSSTVVAAVTTSENNNTNEGQLEEERREKENELRRRRESRETLSMQSWQKEQELKTMQERLRRNRQAEQEARDRVLAQIAADRAEQAHRDLKPVVRTVEPVAAPAATTDPSLVSVELTRLQIRLPSGVHNTRAFAAGEPLTTVRCYVREELLTGSNIRNFTLATSYPRREFKVEDEIKTLRELNLVPNAVVLVLTSDQTKRLAQSGGSLLTMLATIMWAMLTPAAKAFDYINKMGLQRVRQSIVRTVSNFGMFRQHGGNLAQGPIDGNLAGHIDRFAMPPPGLNNTDQPQAHPVANPGTDQPASVPQAAQTAAKPQPVQHAPKATPQTQEAGQPQSGAQFQQRPGGYQPPRYGDANIRRLQDNKNDDDKATYNGNSTQQQ